MNGRTLILSVTGGTLPLPLAGDATYTLEEESDTFLATYEKLGIEVSGNYSFEMVSYHFAHWNIDTGLLIEGVPVLYAYEMTFLSPTNGTFVGRETGSEDYRTGVFTLD